MSGVNKITRTVNAKSIFASAQSVIDATVSINQGDLVVLTGGLLAHAALEADGATMLGISSETIVLGKLARPYSTDVDASAGISDVPGPVYGVIAKVVLKTGAALAKGALVYLNPAAGTRHVQEAGTKAIGVYQGATIAAATAGQEIEVLIGARYPSDTLQL